MPEHARSGRLTAAPSHHATHLERLQEGVEIDEHDLRQLVLPRVDEEEHVGDAQKGQENQGGLHRLPGGRGGKGDKTHLNPHCRWVLTGWCFFWEPE